MNNPIIYIPFLSLSGPPIFNYVRGAHVRYHQISQLVSVSGYVWGILIVFHTVNGTRTCYNCTPKSLIVWWFVPKPLNGFLFIYVRTDGFKCVFFLFIRCAESHMPQRVYFQPMYRSFNLFSNNVLFTFLRSVLSY